MEDNTAPDTSNFLDWVEIKNFKSIKHLRLDCKRVNIFIGKPNVGKSNILEALGMLGITAIESRKYMDSSVRYESTDQLFFDSNTSEKISISTSLVESSLKLDERINWLPDNIYVFDWLIKKQILNSDGGLHRSFDLGEDGIVKATSAGTFTNREDRDHFKSSIESPIRKYDFRNLTEFKNSFSRYLLPPHGQNLYEVINRNSLLWNEFAKLFLEQGLEFILSDANRTFVLQKKEGIKAKQYPFFSIADTFRRFMFYITAIESNKNSVLVLEEPEVHSFPPYTKALAHRIASHDENQYFISTHSPYILQTLISEVDEADLAVYITYYKDYQTHVRLLTAEELQEAQDLSIDLFYNLSRYEPNA